LLCLAVYFFLAGFFFFALFFWIRATIQNMSQNVFGTDFEIAEPPKL